MLAMIALPSDNTEKEHTNDTSFHATHKKSQSREKFSSLYATMKSHLWVLLRQNNPSSVSDLQTDTERLSKKHLFEE